MLTSHVSTCTLSVGSDLAAGAAESYRTPFRRHRWSADREAIPVSEKEADLPDSDDACERTIDEHLQDLPDGSGCVEIWEQLSERREANDD